jgi:hypothetical protein
MYIVSLFLCYNKTHIQTIDMMAFYRQNIQSIVMAKEKVVLVLNYLSTMS